MGIGLPFSRFKRSREKAVPGCVPQDAANTRMDAERMAFAKQMAVARKKGEEEVALTSRRYWYDRLDTVMQLGHGMPGADAQALACGLMPAAKAVLENRAPATSAPPMPASGPTVASLVPPANEAAPRARIEAAGGCIEDVVLGNTQLPHDFVLIAPDTPPRWVAYHSSLERLGTACDFFAGIAAFAGRTHREPTEVVLDYPVQAASLGLLLNSLYLQPCMPTADNCVELAKLIDYLGPCSNSPWHDLSRACADAFSKIPVQADNVELLLHRLAQGGPAVGGWVDSVAAGLSEKDARGILGRLPPGPLATLVSSRKLCLPEQHILERVKACASRYKGSNEPVGAFLREHGLTAAIRWGDVRESTLWQCDRDGWFTADELARILRWRNNGLASDAFGEKSLYTRARPAHAGLPIVVDDEPALRRFRFHWHISNFIRSAQATTKTPTWVAAGRSWTAEVSIYGIHISATSGEPLDATTRLRAYGKNDTEQVAEYKASECYYTPQHADSEDFEPRWYDLGLTYAEITATNSTWLDSSGGLYVLVDVSY